MKPRSMPMKLFGWFKRSQYPINRIPTYRGNTLGERSETLGVVLPIRLYHGIARLHQSRHFAQQSVTIGQGIDSNRRNHQRNSTSRNTPFDSGRIRSEPLPWLADDVLAVQRIRPEEGKTDESPVLDRERLFQNSPLRHIFRPRLSEEQKHILAMVLRGESVFFTGSAGTGKSVLLRAIIEALGGPSDEVAVTASTGISAIHIGGQTLHSFAGVGLGHGDINMLIRRIKYDNAALMRWWKAKVLIIDEVSMVDATWFDQLEQIARRVRNRDKPFGGIQLVICGDFFQLPPVPNRDFIDAPASFVFDSWTWDICVKNKFMLTQVFRQKDPKLVKMLDDARIGVVTDESAELLKSLARPVHYEDGIGPTEVYPRRFEADLANRRQLLALPGQSRVYAAHDSHGKDDDDQRVDPERAGKLFAGMMAPKLLPLKVGAQVMCLRNIRPNGLVNGSIGRVVDFMTPSQVRTYAESNPRWSIVTSIKMPQPSSQVVAPAADTQIPGRRTRTGWLYELFEKTEWPLVQFMDGQCVLMGPTTFAVETRKGTMEVQRLQVPLVLAWALTVHKSQGQTLERVKINLQRTFEKGQAYVALSRCTSLETLEVYGFDRHRSVQAHPRVQQWARSLTTLNSLAPPAASSRRYPYPVRKTRKALGQ